MLTVYVGGRMGPKVSHRPWSPPEDQGLASKEGPRRPGCVCSGSPGPSSGPAGHTEGAQNKYLRTVMEKPEEDED